MEEAHVNVNNLATVDVVFLATDECQIFCQSSARCETQVEGCFS